MSANVQSSERNIAANAAEMVRILARRAPSGMLPDAIAAASGHDLFTWWHEAQCHVLTAEETWQKKMGEALAGEIAKEAVRRCGNQSID